MLKEKLGRSINFLILLFLSLGSSKYTFTYLKQPGGIAQGHAKGKVPFIPNYSTINRRINRLDIKIKEDNENKEFQDKYLIIAIDSTIIKVTNRGLGG